MPENLIRSFPVETPGWSPDAVRRYVAAGYWHGQSIGERLRAIADEQPNAVSLVDGDTRLRYRDLMELADGAAVRLAELGLRSDDRVVLQLPNCWELIVVMVACLRLGVLPVMAIVTDRRQEIALAAEHAQARALIVPGYYRDFDHQAMAAEVAAGVGSVEHILVVGDCVREDYVDLRELCRPAADVRQARRQLDELAPAGTAVALFLQSGGTTGLPKLIPRTHNDFAYMADRAGEICGLGRDTRYLAALPLGHGYPMAGPGALGTLLHGGQVVFATSPAPERAFELIEQHRVTMTSLVPAVMRRWLEYRRTDRTADLSSLELLQVAGSRLPDAVAVQVMPAFDCTLQQVYGMAEGLLCMTRPDDPPDVLCRTQGRPICPDDELLLVDEDGEPVAGHEAGILLTRGPYTPPGYYRAPELTERVFSPDGWYNTGDVVRRRPDGNLVLEGRAKDLINRGGEKVWAEEIEGFAYQLPGVDLAAAIPMPDDSLGELACLYVVPAAGSTVLLSEIRRAMMQAGIAGFKLPERLILIPEMPLTKVGKIDKKALRADIEARLAAERDLARASQAWAC